MKDDKPIILFECKAAGASLDENHASQLFRYFTATEARFGVLTNGVVYRFYSDLDEPNKMDPRPFLELNMLEIDDALVDDLKRFSKSSFNLDSTLEAATELKYTKEIKRILSQQLREPSDEFVRLFATQIYSGRMTQSVRERFTQFTRQALNQFINDRVYDRLKSAMTTGGETASDGVVGRPDDATSADTTVAGEGSLVITTEDEYQAYYIVKAILLDVVDMKRVDMRNLSGVGNCRILLDDNRRKPICGLWFSTAQKYLGLFDEQRQEDRVPIEGVDQIYMYADRLKAAVTYYDQPMAEGESIPE